MSNKVYLLFLIITLSIQAQVGVNTKNPTGLFHIDNSIASGTGTSENDVIISEDGNLSIGTNTATSKLNIKTKGTAAVPISGFRMEDGNQSNGKILTSDNNGFATWQYPNATGKATVIRTQTAQVFDAGVYTALILGKNTEPQYTEIPITKSGNYCFMIRWWGLSQESNVISAGNFRLLVNGIAGYQSEYIVPSAYQYIYNFGFNVMLTQYLNINDKVEIQLNPTVEWRTRPATTGNGWNLAPSIVMTVF